MFELSSILFVSTMSGYSWGGSEELWSRLRLISRHGDSL